MKRATNTDSNGCGYRRYFNPRPHEEGDQDFFIRFLHIFNFNPRPHEEGDGLAGVGAGATKDFNPRPHEEGDLASVMFQVTASAISIHALTKRATGYDCSLPSITSISIHALMKRAT